MKLKVVYTTCHSKIIEIPSIKSCDDLNPEEHKKLLETLWEMIPDNFGILGWEEAE